MRVLYCGPRRMSAEDEHKLGMTFVSLDQLLAESDFVSLHPPLRADTRHLINERALRRMKRSAYLINTARGPIVDEAALVKILKEKRIAGAGLDVFEHEPKVPAALRRMKNVVLAPHLGSAVVEVREAMANVVVDNILALMEGRRPANCVNPEVFKP
jgi:glyoxylate reductase